MNTAESIQGIWKLDAWKTYHEGKHVPHPHKPAGKPPETWQGLLIYDKSGYMSMTLSAPERSHHKDAEYPAVHGTDKEKAQSHETFIGYAGTYEIDEKTSSINHHVRLSSFPNWVGQSLNRQYEIKNGAMILSISGFLIEGKKYDTSFHWKKVDS